MEVILIIWIIFIVLLFLPNKKESQQFNNETLDKIGDLIWFDECYILSTEYSKILKDIVKENRKEHINILKLLWKLKKYKDIWNNRELDMKFNLMIELLSKIYIFLIADNIEPEEKLSNIALLSTIYHYISATKKIPNLKQIVNIWNWIYEILWEKVFINGWEKDFLNDSNYIKMIQLFINYTKEELEDKIPYFKNN